MTNTEFILIDDIQGIKEIETDWNHLVRDNSNIFLDFQWNLAWLESHADEVEILTFIHRSNAIVDFIAPLVIRKNKYLRFLRRRPFYSPGMVNLIIMILSYLTKTSKI